MNNQRTRLVLQFHVGQDENGKDLISSKSFQNIAGDASDLSLTTVAEGLISLQQHQVFSISRQNTYQID
ncbi:DUF1659 domain-containing protein [Alkalicoccobacillus murimartini]|uniref:DUF1659 domain-containing protein n=1 Tax=Alkalicoccobacillus murimartini TaxID=171685 RepID=A0ABT9YCP8_9BACI|nr:DUF1659 domain-containing protein [Alkalicoccobacillus murimartini]MDQ0205623.1 hypothetical protein [Alkalicoccobacillus murimartini]